MAVNSYLDYEGLVELINKIKEKFAPIQAIQYKGTVANIAGLPTVANAAIGDMYNIVTGGTTTADFVEGAGHKISNGTNVIAINTEQDPTQPAIMKWDILPGVFNLDDRLQFGTTMPDTDLTNGRTFLYLGDTTYTYSQVTPVGTENPKELGWYEYDSVNEVYTLTNDETVQSGTDYYTRQEQYVKGVIYVYSTSSSAWVAQTAGDTFTRITEVQIDALFE